MKGEGPFTVFAPTDDAFAKLPKATIDALLADPEGQLTQILLYHVLPNTVMAAEITDGMEAETLQGSPVKFTVNSDGSVMINDANIVMTDIAATNGVIHVIDSVILPPAEEAAAEAAPKPLRKRRLPPRRPLRPKRRRSCPRRAVNPPAACP